MHAQYVCPVCILSPDSIVEHPRENACLLFIVKSDFLGYNDTRVSDYIGKVAKWQFLASSIQ